jgi:hypothetical protein
LNRSQFAFAILLLAAVVLFPLLASLRRPSALARWPKTTSADEAIIFFNPGSGLLLEEKSETPGVMAASFKSVLRSPYFAPDLQLERHMASGDFLCHALFLPERADKAYFIFDRLPATHAGYLLVKLRLLEHAREAWLYHVDDFAPAAP